MCGRTDASERLSTRGSRGRRRSRGGGLEGDPHGSGNSGAKGAGPPLRRGWGVVGAKAPEPVPRGQGRVGGTGGARRDREVGRRCKFRLASDPTFGRRAPRPSGRPGAEWGCSTSAGGFPSFAARLLRLSGGRFAAEPPAPLPLAAEGKLEGPLGRGK